MTAAIENYGIIGDMSSAALVGLDGSIDWCCLPRFDSPSVFAALLDQDAGGRFRIAPTDDGAQSTQAYVGDTNILRTSFTTATGRMSVTDFMPPRLDDAAVDAPHEIHRVVICEDGEASARCVFEPRPDYARAWPSLTPLREGVLARGGRQALKLLSDVPLRIERGRAVGDFTLRRGESARFALAYGADGARRIDAYRSMDKLELTRRFWERTVSRLDRRAEWSDAVTRSFLALRLMTHERSGAIIAAPTTSLPETLGGSRNWDYRYAWLRDSAFTVDILYRMGDADAGDRYIRWLLERCDPSERKTRIVYGIAPNSSLRERTLDHLAGYAGSRPVRIGNGAARHLQLDVFGEVILAIHTLYRLKGGIPPAAWSLVAHFAETVVSNWRRRDRGVWEVRGERAHFVYSKIMCWAALDRAARIADGMRKPSQAARWRSVAAVIRREALGEGWSERKRAFRQRYGGDALDASNLVIPFIGFLPPDDPRIRQNADAIERELADGAFARRYLPCETDDGLGSQPEGAFTLLSFWLIGNLLFTGQLDKAEDFFERVMSRANHLGLFAEMIDPATGGFLGNFPQAYSHVGAIHTARNLARARRGEPLSDGIA